MMPPLTDNSRHREKARQGGFTLIEVILTIVIMGILVATTMRALKPVAETARIEQTKQEMDELQTAILGDATLENNGTRNDFGYVGDVGSLPPNLTALASNTGGYATWRGPYIKTGFIGAGNDYLTDAWGADYVYSGGVNITSVGSGSSITKKLSNSTGDLLFNKVSGVILDRRGIPPGPVFLDSVSVSLVVPNGAGAMTTKTIMPDPGGYFAFDSIPVGNHDIHVVFLPDNDSLSRFVSVIPQASVYAHYSLDSGYFSDTASGGEIALVADSDTLSNPHCSKLTFWIRNDSPAPITVSWIRLNWLSPTSYYQNVTWNAIGVRSGNPALGSGDVATFSSPMTINTGESVAIATYRFRSNPGGGGSNVNMTGTDFTVELSDGSTFSFTVDLCNP